MGLAQVAHVRRPAAARAATDGDRRRRVERGALRGAGRRALWVARAPRRDHLVWARGWGWGSGEGEGVGSGEGVGWGVGVGWSLGSGRGLGAWAASRC